MARLFQARAARVLGSLPVGSVADWLSGLLIGNEVRQMQLQWRLGLGDAVAVVGSPALLQRYTQALAAADLTAIAVDGDIAFQAGIGSIAHELDC
jgi:2-dehydro-3-deoxygalactonokinase